MATPLQAGSVGAKIADLLHSNIANLIDGNHVRRDEVLSSGGRSCPCQLAYEVDWSFVPYTSNQQIAGDGAVSTHFGYDERGYNAETARRCEMGRTHKPIRHDFMSRVLAKGSDALQEVGQSVQIWNFGQHSVYAQCVNCRGKGRWQCGNCQGEGRCKCTSCADYQFPRGRKMCPSCSGRGTINTTRWIDGQPVGCQDTCSSCGGLRHVPCFQCGGSGYVSCSGCNGSGVIVCNSCNGHGLFTYITSVTVQAEPTVRVTVRSELSQGALLDYLVKLPVSSAVWYLDFTQSGHQDAADDVWRVDYEVHTTVVELDIKLRGKTYTAAAVGDKALTFIKPPIFDDVFIEEITDLKKIWSGKKQSFSIYHARKFFYTYAGQPVLDAAMKSVASLKGKDRETPGLEVINACKGYISNGSAETLGKCISMLLDKVSPSNSIWAWVGVMTMPFLILFLGAQAWFEDKAPAGYVDIGVAWIILTVVAPSLTTLISPIAAMISAIVSFIRRRAIPPEYRQHGRNWQPFKRFVKVSIAVAWLGGGLGLLTHHGILPRWNNLNTIIRWTADDTLKKQDKIEAVVAAPDDMGRRSGHDDSSSPRESTAKSILEPVVEKRSESPEHVAENFIEAIFDGRASDAFLKYASNASLEEIAKEGGGITNRQMARPFLECGSAPSCTEGEVEAIMRKGGAPEEKIRQVKRNWHGRTGRENETRREAHEENASKGGLLSITTTLVSQTEYTAEVRGEVKFGNGETRSNVLTLIKEAGEWKVKD